MIGDIDTAGICLCLGGLYGGEINEKTLTLQIFVRCAEKFGQGCGGGDFFVFLPLKII